MNSKMYMLFDICMMLMFIFSSSCEEAIVTQEYTDTDSDSDSDTDSDSDSDGDTDSDTDSDTDTDTDSDTDTDTEETPTWLIHISDDKLWHISIETGEATEVCELIPEEGVELPPVQSVTFTRDDRLLVASSSTRSLWELFLPSCEIKKLGEYTDEGIRIPGICPDEKEGIYGISKTDDSFYRIDTNNAVEDLVGSLNADFGSLGATWVEEEQEVYAITDLGYEDSLYRVDKLSGQAVHVANLTEDFESVGMEHHPHNGVIYACTSIDAGEGWESPPLFRVELDGTTTLIGLTGLPETCSNLGAPWGNPDLPPPV